MVQWGGVGCVISTCVFGRVPGLDWIEEGREGIWIDVFDVRVVVLVN